MPQLLSVDKALAQILDDMQPLDSENVALAEALDRVIASDIAAPLDLPPFDNSAMDGYAIRHKDSVNASQQQPATLRVTQDIPAGAAPTSALQPGQAARIMTGAPIPPGCSAVAPVEDTNDNWRKRGNPALPEEVQVYSDYAFGANIRRKGENIERGATIMRAGTVIQPAEIGMLAAIGCARFAVVRKPKVVILSSGDELVDVHEALDAGKIRDTNSYALAGLIRQAGGIPIRLPIARDNLSDIRALYNRALGINPDMIISSAGVSVGAADLVREVMDELGDIDFWRINMRPGKPLAYGALQGIPFFGLPGNPVSTMVTFEVFVRPALAKLARRALRRKTLTATIAEDLRSDGRRSYNRVRLAREGACIVAHSTGSQSSGALMSMLLADGLAIIPEGQRLAPAGSELPVLLLRPFE
ncbi:MAG: molybdopterin molybdotransferase MoeA [Chloroflexi bacterium]|nr:molybdopterin molybdotransferase MoeA [Chloroflexota bacterium]MCY4246935.1 molybdopterin molybdotransferase MoeA [Chloroflexota bacterium]